mgnify:CR=1 FL=1
MDIIMDLQAAGADKPFLQYKASFIDKCNAEHAPHLSFRVFAARLKARGYLYRWN